MEFVAAEAAEGGKRPSSPASALHGLCFQVLGWNIGGPALEQLPNAISICTDSPLKESILLLQECSRVENDEAAGADGFESQIPDPVERMWTCI